jgi:hypothetical protein
MAKAPPIPPAQQGGHDPNPDAKHILGPGDPRARKPDDSLGEQANRRQNTSHARNVQDR